MAAHRRPTTRPCWHWDTTPTPSFRGNKADIYEGGHRVPFLARWKGEVRSWLKMPDTICLTDFMATCAEITGTRLPDSAGEDSVSFLFGLLGRGTRPRACRGSPLDQWLVRDSRRSWKLHCVPLGRLERSASRERSPQGLLRPSSFDLSQDNRRAEEPDR